jgi:predicted transcriptional regulator
VSPRSGSRKANLTDVTKFQVGGGLHEDSATFRHAWEQAEQGQISAPDRVLAFESWDTVATIMIGERFRKLRHLHGRADASISALAHGLGRYPRRVQADSTR